MVKLGARTGLRILWSVIHHPGSNPAPASSADYLASKIISTLEQLFQRSAMRFDQGYELAADF
jgi:hypothetical protein